MLFTYTGGRHTLRRCTAWNTRHAAIKKHYAKASWCKPKRESHGHQAEHSKAESCSNHPDPNGYSAPRGTEGTWRLQSSHTRAFHQITRSAWHSHINPLSPGISKLYELRSPSSSLCQAASSSSALLKSRPANQILMISHSSSRSPAWHG